MAAVALTAATVSAFVPNVGAQMTKPGTLSAYAIVGDTVPTALEGKVGDADRGRRLVLDRAIGNCLICHALAREPNERFQGNIGPDLDGVAARQSAGQIRLRLIDQSRLNPNTVMPPYYRIDGLTRVAARFAGQPALEPQQIEDIVSFLTTLKD